MSDKKLGSYWSIWDLQVQTILDDDYIEQLSIIKKELDAKDCIAVGEIGIDLYWDKSTLKIQQEAFKYQIQLIFMQCYSWSNLSGL